MIQSPVQGEYRVSRAFGVPGNYAAGYHTGRDYAADLGTPLVAVRNGVVRGSSEGAAYGIQVVLEADNNRDYLYAHLQTVVKTGVVKAGDVIARVGQSGNATGPHLHLEDRPRGGKYGQVRDPFWGEGGSTEGGTDMIKGVDVSSYQSENYSTSGLDFVFIKISEGTSYVNPKWIKQRETARKVGLVTGFYHFVRPGSMTAQADYFLSKAGTLSAGDMLVLDWEDPGVSGASKDEWIKYVKSKRPGHKVLLYCNVDYWKNRDKTSYAGDGLWIAHYGPDPGKPGITAPWVFHQYTSDPIDTNVGKFADRAALRKWAGGEIKPPPPPPPREEEDMTPEQVFKAVWERDAIKAPDDTDTATNPTWMAGSFLRDTNATVRAMRTSLVALSAKVDAQAVAIDKLVDALGKDELDSERLKREIREAIESIVVRLDVPEAPQ